MLNISVIGFTGGPLIDVDGSLRLLDSSHVRERERKGVASMHSGTWCLEWVSLGCGRTSAL